MSSSQWLIVVNNLTQIIGTCIAIIGGLYAFYRWLVKPFKKFLKTVTDRIEILDALNLKISNEILPLIITLKSELSNNGGKSFKDRIERIDTNVQLAELRSKLIASNLITTGAFECNPQGECTWANKALGDLYGLSNEELLGKKWLVAVVESERSDVWEQWTTAIHIDIPYEDTYTVQNRRTNEFYKCRATTITHKTLDGRVIGYYGNVTRVI